MVSPEFEKNLEKYADVIVRVGLNLRAGQRLIISGPVEAIELVRAVTRKAYQAGARYVETMFNDDLLTLARFQYAPRDTFEESAPWRSKVMADFGKHGDATLSISGSDPDLLAGQDPQLIQTVRRIGIENGKEFREYIEKGAINWLVVSYPTAAWAAKVLPEVPEAQREERMWDLIFEMSRTKSDDPVGAWKKHVENLDAYKIYLNQKRYTGLKYTGPGTDLTVGLPDGYLWAGAALIAQNGITCVPNIPTEEVFTMPHKNKVDGVVMATKPLSYSGTLIQNFSLTFEAGRVIKATAEKGEEMLNSILETDEGSRRLGEIALVPNSSPISKSGRIFYNTLFDENASCHIALGMAYRETLEGGPEMTAEDFAAKGGNDSKSHVDFMIGSGELNIDGITADGKVEPVMRNGEWAFTV